MKKVSEKACLVVLRTRNSELQILAFHHPKAGIQLVKGSIEPGESPEQAAMRELFEESGLQAQSAQWVTTVLDSDPGPTWHLVKCEIEDSKEKWEHACQDDGGQIFNFFWYQLAKQPDNQWLPIFHVVLSEIRRLNI
ncbi:MAG: NUDIX domain-containing protein [Paracoccaceae bacterium]